MKMCCNFFYYEELFIRLLCGKKLGIEWLKCLVLKKIVRYLVNCIIVIVKVSFYSCIIRLWKWMNFYGLEI